MALRTVAGVRTGEDSQDLCDWLKSLDDCPRVTRTLTAHCAGPAHDGEALTWFYVEADARHGIARRRCLACGSVVALLDSAARWEHTPMWSCRSCAQSIAEMAVGVHVRSDGDLDDGSADERATWLAVGVRCVQCGRLDGVTDLFVPGLSLAEIAAAV
ncbi:MAG: hypothetical protein M3Z02_08715 [Actinomycetota bacterium]|nr:hypothetical protein [Actinomycetota bacterium]